MRTRVAALALGTLALAAPAAAGLPHVPSGSVIGGDVPLKAYANLTPPVHLFGDPVTATVAVVADTKWVDPSRLRVTADFRPYKPLREPTVLRTGSGRFLQITWTWTLRCLTAPCVPRAPPSDRFHVFHFTPAHIDYLARNGSRLYGVTASFPAVEALSEVGPGTIGYLVRHKALRWHTPVTPVATPVYRISPGLVFWLGLALAGAFALAGLALAGRILGSYRRPAAALEPGEVTAPALDRALALFYWARERGDDTLQRKALERVADELEPEGTGLSEEARALAWSEEAPEDEQVESLSEHAHRPPLPEERAP